MRPLRITMAIGQLSQGVGGCEQQALRLAAALRRRNHEVEILTSRPHGTPVFERINEIPVYRLFNFGNRRLLWRLGIYSFMAHLGQELMRRKDWADVFHIHQAQHAACAAVASRAVHRRPVLVKLATAGEYGDIHQMRSGQAFPGSRYLLSTVLKADRIIAISDELANELRANRVPDSRIVRIPNGVALPVEPVTPEQRLNARGSLGLPRDAEVVVYVGRCKQQKAPDLLLQAWQRLRGRPHCHLLVVGEGFKENAQFQTAALESSRLHLCGRVNGAQDYMAAADVLLHPSRGEGLSNTLLEAMALGLPIVASGITANGELLRGGAGLLAPPEDGPCLGLLVEALLDDHRRRAALALAARERALQYDLNTVAERYEAVYRGLVQGPPLAAGPQALPQLQRHS